MELARTVGIDTETTGLSYRIERTVGYCFAVPNEQKKLAGYYLPIRHLIGKNLDVHEVVNLAQYALDNKKTMFFNRNFDFSHMENDGVVINFNIDTHDVQPMCWMASNEGFPSLKKYCRDYLKYKMVDFGDVTEGASFNFGETDPELTYTYGAFDPVATVMLGRKMWADYPYIRRIYPIDNRVTECCRLLGQVDVHLNYKILKDSLLEEEKELRSLKAKAIALAGYEFNVGSNQQKAEALSRFVTLTAKTKSGAFSVKDEVLQAIDHPLAATVLEYSKKVKFISSYLKTLIAMEGAPVFINFKTVDVPTGRMASGQVKGNDYYAKFNIQSTPKKEKKRYLHPHPVLGYWLTDEPEGALKTCKVKAGIRDAFDCPEGYVFVTADFKGEELTIAANLSDENIWLDALNLGHDLHTETAKAVFGTSDDESRGKIKIFNFMCVGRNSQILTSGGVFRPYNLTHNHRLLNQFGERQKWSALEVENEPTVTLEFRNGVVEEYREGHKLQVYTPFGRDWVKVEDLDESHDVLYSPGHFKEGPSQWYVKESDYTERVFNVEPKRVWDFSSNEVAYLAGYYLGDGHCSKNHSTLNWLTDVECTTKVKSCLTKLGLEFNVESYPGKDYQLISVYCRAFGRAFHEFFGRTKEKTISDKVMETWGKPQFVELLAGLMDSDGTRMKKPVFVNTNKELVHKVAVVAIGVGMTTQMDYRTSKLKGVSYPFYELTFVQGHQMIPISVTRRKSPSLKVQSGFRYFDSLKLQHLPNSAYNWQLGNIRAGRSKKVSLNNQQLLEDLEIANVRPTQVVSSAKGTGTIYTIMCDSHEYLSSNMVSHNTLYGANEWTIAQRVKCTVEEAKDMLNLYYSRLPKLTRWKKYVVDTARRKGMVFTYYGRPRLLYKYYSSSDPKLKSFADRSAVNSIVQGCLPAHVMIETKDSAIMMNKVFLKKVRLADGREAIPSSRGVGRIWKFRSRSGEFILADEQHCLIHGDLKKPKYRRVCDGLDVKVNLAPLRRKVFPHLKTLFSKSKQNFMATLSMRNEVKRSSRHSAMFFRAWFTRKKIYLDDYHSASLRSVASVHGFNLVDKKGHYRLKWSRPRKVTISTGVFIGDAGIGSLTLTSGLQQYPSQGFMNKNTGGDIMRILLCQLFQERASNPEFKKNVIVAWHVHDEVNSYVKPEYLYEYYTILKQLMTIKHSNWKAPLGADIGIGTCWGNPVDILGVTKDNKLVVEGVNDEDLKLC